VSKEKTNQIVSHSIKPFRRFGVEIDECLWCDGKPYFTTEAIKDWLGYKKEKDPVSRVVRKNPYILQYSKEIEVLEEIEQTGKALPPRSGGNAFKNRGETRTTYRRTRALKMRIYDPIGLQLIAFESRTPKAKAYKIKVARLVWALVEGKLATQTENQEKACDILAEAARAARWERRAHMERYMLLTGYTASTAYRHLEKARQGDSPFDKKYRNNTNYIVSKKLELRVRKMFFANPETPAKEIWRQLKDPDTGKYPVSYKVIRKFVSKLRREQERV